MKKLFIILNLLVFSACNCVYAAGMVYDPTEYKVDEQVNKIGSVKLPSNNEINNNIQASTRLAQDAVSGQSENFNNALFELHSAQVNIRNELLHYHPKYQELHT